MQPSASLAGKLVPRAAEQLFFIFGLLLITAPSGGHSLHLAGPQDIGGHHNSLDRALETTKITTVKTSRAAFTDIWKNLESIQKLFSKSINFPHRPENLLMKQNSGQADSSMTAAAGILEGHSRVESLRSNTDSSEVFVAVFCSLAGAVLAVLLVVFGFVVWREAYEISERKRRQRNQLPLAGESSAYTAYPRDDSPSNFHPVDLQLAFEEQGSGATDLGSAPTYHRQQIASVHPGRSILRRVRRHPNKVVRVREPAVDSAPSIGQRYTKYDVTGIELTAAQKWHHMEMRRMGQRY